MARGDTVVGFDAVRDNWDQVYRDDPDAQHFLSWTWLKDFLGHRGRWFVLALREREPDSAYVAFFPLRLTTKLDAQSGVFYDEIIMGGNYSADYTGFIVMPGYEQDAISGFAAYLKEQNWTHLRLEHYQSFWHHEMGDQPATSNRARDYMDAFKQHRHSLQSLFMNGEMCLEIYEGVREGELDFSGFEVLRDVELQHDGYWYLDDAQCFRLVDDDEQC